jgi:hypothetical protein
MNPFWFLRMSKWARHRPSDTRVKLVGCVILLALAIVGIEWMGWWPDWATVEPRRR